uniref:Uncharacterized protein n=1 Tax=Anguilla anguilla TaxID=7936 RepID=A0A0E9PW55_ANGAN
MGSCKGKVLLSFCDCHSTHRNKIYFIAV